MLFTVLSLHLTGTAQLLCTLFIYMILVTGGSGFLGQHLVRRLAAQGLPVRAQYYAHPPDPGLAKLHGTEWQQCDLLDVYAVEELMQGITEVYHCAGIVSFDPKRRDEMLHFNPESTANVVNEALQKAIRKMVYVSSVAALGRTGDGTKVTDEEQEWGESRYNSAYGISKYLAEMEVWRGIGEGLNAVIVNPSVMLGAGDWRHGSPQLMAVVNKEFPFYTGGVNGWVDVEDVVTAMTMLMTSDIEGERFIVNEGNYPFRDIFTRMAMALDKKPPRIPASRFLSQVLTRMGKLFMGRETVITKETVRNAHSVSRYDNSKLTRALPAFAYTPIDQTINRMAAAFKGGKTT